MATPSAEATPPPAQHPDEPHESSIASRLNWLRAGVLGANDGIVSTAGIVVGRGRGDRATGSAILVAGVAGLFAGALSMAAGEYVSVCTQRDSERALLAKERRELREEPEEELAELAGFYVEQGAERRARAAGGPRAHGPRRARRARGGRARHRPRRPHQPVARRLGLDARVHGRRAAAPAHDQPGRCRDPARRDRRVGDGGAGPDRVGQRAPRPGAPGPGRAPQRRRRDCSRWPSPTSSGSLSAAASAERDAATIRP